MKDIFSVRTSNYSLSGTTLTKHIARIGQSGIRRCIFGTRALVFESKTSRRVPLNGPKMLRAPEFRNGQRSNRLIRMLDTARSRSGPRSNVFTVIRKLLHLKGISRNPHKNFVVGTDRFCWATFEQLFQILETFSKPGNFFDSEKHFQLLSRIFEQNFIFLFILQFSNQIITFPLSCWWACGCRSCHWVACVKIPNIE